MSRFINTSTRDVFDVPDALDSMYTTRPEVQPYSAGTEALTVPSATAPAGATGDPVPTFDAALPLAAGASIALDNIDDIKGQPLDESLEALGLDTSGKADDKRDRLAARLNEEIDRG